MRTREKIELGLIATVAVTTWFFATRLPVKLPAGYLILAASVLLLGQGLLRDLYVKYIAKKDHPAVAAAAAIDGQPANAPKKIVCMCMESTVGVAGVVGGLAILLCGIGSIVEVPFYFWPALVLCVGVVGFVIKDFVLDWKARSVRRVKDHQSIIPW